MIKSISEKIIMNKMGKKKMMNNLIILMLLFNNTSINDTMMDFNDNNDTYIMISKTGVISLRTLTNIIIWEKQLNKPLIETNININAIEFNQTNVLPGDEGRLYLVNFNQSMFSMLNATIKDLVLNSPTTLPWFESKVFIGRTIKTTMHFDMKNGLIISVNDGFRVNSQTTDMEYPNKQFKLMRSDYLVELHDVKRNSLIEWNAKVSQVEVTSIDNRLHYSTEDLSPVDWNILEMNKKDYLYMYKYDHCNDSFIKMGSDVDKSTRNQVNDDNDYLPYYTHSNSPLFQFESSNSNSLIMISLLTLSIVFIMLYIQITVCSWLVRVDENDSDELNEIQTEDEVNKRNGTVSENKQSIESINISQISTKSVMNKSIDEMQRRFSQTFNPQVTLSLSLVHKDSAPEYFNNQKQLSQIENNDEKQKEKEKQSKLVQTLNWNENDEQLAPHKTFQMQKIQKHHSITKPKSAPPLQINQYQINPKASSIKFRKTSETLMMPKKKYKPTQDEQSQLNQQIAKYLEDISSSNNTCLKLGRNINQIDQCNLYHIINQSMKEEDQSNSFRKNFNKKRNVISSAIQSKSLSLCDSGRFINTFDHIQLIGKGGFGSVFKAVHKIDGSSYAIKVIKFSIELNQDLSKIDEVKEVKTMMRLDCSNIVRYITCWFEFEDGNKRGRSLSMDEKKDNAGSEWKDKRQSQFPVMKNKGIPAIQSTTSEFELIINETSKEDFNKRLYNKEEDYFKPNFNIEDKNRNEDDDLSFDNDYSQYDNIIFGTEDDDDNDNDSDGDNDKIYFNSFLNNNNDNQLKHSDNIRRHSKRKKTEKIAYPVYFFMQMEYCKGFTLSYYLKIQQSPLPGKIRIHFFNQLANAVQVIHSQHIIHRDLKPANIFIKPNFKLKIGDFGLAAEMDQYSFQERVGTFLYQSPEQLEGKTYNEKVDIFALGLILLELCLLFETDSERHYVLTHVKKGDYPIELKQYPIEYSLIKLMTNLNPANRPNIQSILNSVQMLELLDGL